MLDISITKGSSTELTITIPFENQNMNEIELYTRYLIQLAFNLDVTMLFYKVKLQNVMVFNFSGNSKECCDKLQKEIEISQKQK